MRDDPHGQISHETSMPTTHEHHNQVRHWQELLKLKAELKRQEEREQARCRQQGGIEGGGVQHGEGEPYRIVGHIRVQ